jgi:beta-lactamase regulating signal transducer with metallopeptidase domain
MEINQSITLSVANIGAVTTSATASTSAGIFYFLNQYAGAIGLLVSLLMACATITYYISTYRLNKKNSEKKTVDNNKLIKELIKKEIAKSNPTITNK